MAVRALAEQVPYLRRDRAGFAFQLAAGVAEHGEAAATEGEIPRVVVLEGDIPLVVPVAVGFDREGRRAPEEVDRVAADPNVDLRRRQAVTATEAEEVGLEV
jgi:hypothetical protein